MNGHLCLQTYWVANISSPPLIQSCPHCPLPPLLNLVLPPLPQPPPPLPPPMPQDLASATANLTACTPTQMTSPLSICALVASLTWGTAEVDLSLTTAASAACGPEAWEETMCITTDANCQPLNWLNKFSHIHCVYNHLLKCVFTIMEYFHVKLAIFCRLQTNI